MKRYKNVLTLIKALSTNRFGIRMFYFFYKKYPSSYCYEYQTIYRIYLDEYPEQKILREEYFAKKWNLKNEALKRVA